MNKQYHSPILTVMLGLALLLSPIIGIAQASHHVGADAAPAAPLPENLQGVSSATGDWWPAVQKDTRQAEYHVTWQEHTYLADVAAAYQAPNRAHNLRTYFTPQGIRVIPRVLQGETPPWEWGLTLSGYGSVLGVQPVAAATLHSEGNRIEYRHGAPGTGPDLALTEWYVNDERGLEQGFILDAPPSGLAGEGAGEQLVLELAFSGDLAPRLAAGGSTVDLAAADGTTVLRYGPFAATDAAGRPVPLQLHLVARLTIQLLTSDLQYPVILTARLVSLSPAPEGLSPTPNWTAESDQDSAQFGYSVATAGDVNGDGYSDVIVGARYYDNGETDEGRAFVYHGSAGGLSPAPNWTAESNLAYASFGFSVGTAGDVNGDGYADVVVGAPDYTGSQVGGGAVFVYHGGPGGLSPTANWMEDGDWYYGWFGWSVGTAGDVNGDGYADVIVGAPGFDNGQTEEGLAHVYHGGPGGLSVPAAWWVESNEECAELGFSVGTAGDVNGDGYADVIVGAPGCSSESPSHAFAYFGGPTGLSTSPFWTHNDLMEGDRLGYSVGTAGDVNGDGFSDVIVGAPYFDGTGTEDAGYVGVWHGSPSGLPVSSDWSSTPGQSYAHFGSSVGTAGDVNGDGYADLIVGAPHYTHNYTNEGIAFVYHGGANWGVPLPAWWAEGGQAGAGLGASVGTAGDVNGDGYADVLVAAPGYDNGQTDEGRALVYHGGPGDPGYDPNWTAEGNQTDAHFGTSVATAGDVNGDGYADLVVGAPHYDDGQTDEGGVFVYHGGSTGLSATPNWSAFGNQAYGSFGWSVGTAGDVNGDGYADLVVGSPYWDLGQVDEGIVSVYYGGPGGLSTVSWSADSDQVEAYFGCSVGTAGDVNGDGYADLIVGAYRYDGRLLEDEGRAYVYYGAAGGLQPYPGWSSRADQAYAWFGYAVGTAGDMNGDGYSDVVVGAIHYTNGETNEGAAFVYYGGPAGLSTAAGWIEGNQDSAWLGSSVGTAGDVNGDGYADLIVGAPHYTHNYTNEGIAFVYHGGANWGVPLPAWWAEGGQAGAGLGASVGTAGDVNGDGFSDVVVGAPCADAAYADMGYAAVYYGRPTGLPFTASWVHAGDLSSVYFGTSVATAGDVNGDGYADLVVGAPYVDGAYYNEGRAYVYHGNGGGVPMLARQMRADGSAPIAYLGMSDARNGFELRLIGRMPLGRDVVRLQWQAAPLGTLFDHPGVFSGVTGWFDTGTGGSDISASIDNLPLTGMSYHWRVRLLYRPGNALGQSVSRWIHIPWNGWNETDLRLLLRVYLPLTLRQAP
jgi:hypothetical protein